MKGSSYAAMNVLLLAFAVLGAGGAGLWNGFINFDDPDVIVSNSRLDRPSLVDAVEVFGEVRDHAWLPLYYVALMPEAAIFGKKPIAFHGASLVWHFANALLLLVLVLSLTERRFLASAAAALYAVHPVAVESVAWASGRKDQASLFLLLVGLNFWSRHLLTPRFPRGVLALSFALLSCFAKGSTVVFPLLFLAVFLLLRRRGVLASEGRPVRWLVASALLAVVPVAVHLGVAQAEGTTGDAVGFDAVEGARQFLFAMERYAAHLVLPLGLSIHYPPVTGAAWPIAGGIVVIFVAGLAFAFAAGRAHVAGFAAFWFFAAIVPFNNVFPRTSVTAADRYLAVGLPAFTLFVALVLERLAGRTRIIVLAILLVASAGLAARRTMEFKDGETVFRAALATNPSDPLPPAQIAEAILAAAPALDAARGSEAVAFLESSVGLAEQAGDVVSSVRARLRAADTLLRLGSFAAALEHFDQTNAKIGADPRRFVRLGVDRPAIENNRAQCLAGLGRAKDAREVLERLLEENPKQSAAALTLAMMNIRDGFETLQSTSHDEVRDRARHLVNRGLTGLTEIANGCADARRAHARPSRDDVDLEIRARMELGRTLLPAAWQESHNAKAIEQADILLDRWPERAEGHALRAAICEAMGDIPGALAELSKAVERSPADVQLRIKTSRHLRAAGENKKAVEYLRLALAADPSSRMVRRELAAIYVSQANAHKNNRDFNAALLAVSEARSLDPSSAEALAVEGETREARQEWDAAFASYTAAMKLDEQHDAARRGLARYHQVRGLSLLAEIKTRVAAAGSAAPARIEEELRDRVMADFRRAVELGAGSADVDIARRHIQTADRGEKRAAAELLRGRAEAELANGNSAAAEELIRQAIRADGTDLASHYFLARIAIGRSDTDAALKSLEEVLSLDPEFLPGLVAAAPLYYVKGRFDQVRKLGDRVLKLAADEEIRTAFAEEIAAVKKLMELAH